MCCSRPGGTGRANTRRRTDPDSCSTLGSTRNPTPNRGPPAPSGPRPTAPTTGAPRSTTKRSTSSWSGAGHRRAAHRHAADPRRRHRPGARPLRGRRRRHPQHHRQGLRPPGNAVPARSRRPRASRRPPSTRPHSRRRRRAAAADRRPRDRLRPSPTPRRTPTPPTPAAEPRPRAELAAAAPPVWTSAGSPTPSSRTASPVPCASTTSSTSHPGRLCVGLAAALPAGTIAEHTTGDRRSTRSATVARSSHRRRGEGPGRACGPRHPGARHRSGPAGRTAARPSSPIASPPASAGPVPEGMYLSCDERTRSLRPAVAGRRSARSSSSAEPATRWATPPPPRSAWDELTSWATRALRTRRGHPPLGHPRPRPHRPHPVHRSPRTGRRTGGGSPPASPSGA